VILAGRSAAALFAVLALALTGGAYQWQASKNDLLRNVAALDPNSRDILDPNAQFGDENFLIVGVDSRIGANSEMGAGDTSDAEGARSDTVMLVNIPANRKRVVAVSFPRDLAITPMRCEAWDPENGKYGPVYDKQTGEWGDQWRYTETKLNSAYSLGGPKCLVKVIQKLSGLSINRFMAVDFAGFSKMVDALGGVDVCSTTPLEDYELGTVLASAGHQMLDGHSALNYVRARQVTTESNGDYGRIKRQQLFLSSLLRSMISTDTLFSLNKLNNVVNMFIDDTYVDNVRTKDLVDLGQSLQGVAAGRITFVTVPTTGITDADGNEEPRTEDIRALFDAVINDDPLPGENDKNTTSHVTNANKSVPATAAAATPTSTAPESADSAQPMVTELVNAITTEPQDVTVRVSNSTAASGMANTASAELAQHGFNVLDPDDYSTTVQATTVLFSAGNEQAAATVAASFPNARMERVTGLGDVVQVVLGPDFSTVNAPPAGGSAVSVNVSHSGSSTPTQLPDDLTVTNAADVTCE
jgi:LCP family protein required for cell wall assembly